MDTEDTQACMVYRSAYSLTRRHMEREDYSTVVPGRDQAVWASYRPQDAEALEEGIADAMAGRNPAW